MKHRKTSYFLSILFFLFALTLKAQVEVPFTPRLDNSYINIKGDYTFLSNGILNRVDSSNSANDPYNGGSNNNGFHRDYIDIDGDPSTFSSSSSTLTLPFCSRIFYAGLYWSANYQQEVLNNSQIATLPANDTQRLDFTTIKFRVPGGAYVDLTADNDPDPVGEEDDIIHDDVNFKDSPYTCYKNVTNLLQALPDASGEYFVGNIRATRGRSVGGAGGWTLVIIYENPTLSGKYISIFDGYAGVSGSSSADIAVSGFNSIPIGPVRARLGASVVEGDRGITGDAFRIQTPTNPTFTNLSNGANPANNFFNSNITIDGVDVTTRNIASENTLGFDSDIFEISNPANSIIANGETDATLRLFTQGDAFGAFLVTFGIEIIEPNIVLEKKVEDIAGNDITGAGVNLGQYLDYVLSFVNTGNDDATGIDPTSSDPYQQYYTIRDVLPTNTTLDELNITVPTGVVYTFDSVNNEITFAIPDNLVEVGDPISQIRMRVQVAENCFDFVDACTDLIENQAFSTYRGVIFSDIITDDPSVSDFDDCGFTTPGATNFLLDDLENCNYTRTVQLCGEDVLLDAGDNFDAYIWYRDENGDGEIDGGDTVLNDGDPDGDPSTLLVDETGTYIVDKEVADPCKGFQEIIIVELFGATQTNPITALINDTSNTVEGEIVVCPNDGEELPQVFLCGLNDTELIQVNIPDADSIVWEQLDETSCAAATQDCANTDNSCTWNTVANGNDFLAADAGQYRLVINYQNGCFSRFYFNVFKNPLDPQFNSSDIVCNTPGNITVTNMPVDYEFQLVDATNGNIITAYNSNPSFDITTNGAYRVEMRQQGVVDGCIFILDNIGILERDFQVDVATKDTDCNGLGEISISVLDVNPQYYYEISQGGTSVDTFGPSNDNNYTFANLNDGVYDILVTTDDGCSYTGQVTINDVTDLDVTAVTTKPIDCTEGVITVTGSGGFPNPDYVYAIWSFNGTDLYTDVASIPGSAYQIGNDFLFTAAEAGVYEFIVVDGNNCTAISNPATIAVAPVAEYTTSQTDETCFGIADGSFTVNVTNSNGYTLTYELTYPDSSTANNTSGAFTGLPQGNYSLTITQTQGAVSCPYVETFTIGGPVDLPSGNAVLLQDYTCLQQASIEAQNVAGGTAPYEYSIDGVNFVSGAGAATFTNLTDGTYSITIRDNNGCTFTTNAITIDPLVPPSDLSFTATAPNCPANTSDVTVTVTDGETPFVFEIVSPSAIAATSITGNTAAFNGLAPDTYIFRVTDDKGCVYDESFTIDPVTPINVVGSLVSNVSCFNGTDGAIEFTVSGFGTDYNYNITGPDTFSGNNQTATTQPIPGLRVGTYTITVTDNVTNCTDTASVLVEGPAAALSATATVTQPTCPVPGSVLIAATDGWGGYTYEITAGPVGFTPPATQNNGLFNNLTLGGQYTFTVTDLNGCVFTDTFDIIEAIAPTLAIVPNNLCYDAGVGLTLTANVTSGGDGNFEYRLNGGVFDANNVFTGLGPGSYTIDVRDGNDCAGTASITINPELTVVAAAANITACGTTTDIDITAGGGDGNYVFAVVGNGVSPAPGDFGTTNPITVTGAGDYDVYVRDNNGNSGYCEATFDITIVQDTPLAITISNTPVLCSGEAQATITIAASGGEGPYEYSIDNGATYQPSNSFVNQPAGSYDIRVRDANNCAVSEVYTVTEPLTLSASAAVTQLAECNPGVGAEVRITNVLGGTAPYEYSFDGGTNYGASAIEFLLPGTHTVYVRDANNCTFPMPVTVDPEPTPPNVAVSIAYACDGEGMITLTPDSSDFDYTYELDGTPNVPATSNIFSDVAPGNYTATINYSSNIPPTASVLLLEDFGVGPNTPISEIDGDYYCYDPQNGTASPCAPLDGRVTNSPNSRINDLEYSVTNTIVAPFGAWVSPVDASGTPGGRYLAINVGNPGVNTIVYSKRNVEIVPNRDIEVSLDVINLVSAGRNIIEPNILVELVDPFGAIIASGSTGPIPENLGPTDWRNLTIPLDPGANTTIDIVIRTIATGTNGNDVAIDNIRAEQLPEVCAGTVTVPITIDAGNAFDASITAFSNISCAGGSNGEITFQVENFDPVNGYEYQVNGGGFTGPETSATITISGLAATSYTIEVRDILDNSCSITLNQTLTAPLAVTPTASVTTAATCTDGAVITASATDGTPGYLFQLEDTGGTPIAGYDFATNGGNTVFGGVAPGDYIVRVRDTNICENTVAITVDPPENIAFTVTPTTCFTNNNDGAIQIDVTAGNGNYQFSIDGGPWMTPTPATATTYSFTNLAVGTYTVNVRDQFGCVGTATPATVHPLPSALLTVDLTCLADASITITPDDALGTFSYEWSSDGGTTFSNTGFSGTNGNVFTTSTAGSYIFRITDTTYPLACSATTNTVVVTPNETPVITTVTPTHILCNGGTSGALDVTIDTTVGLPPYVIEVVETNTSTNYGTQTTGLPAGDYEVTITDDKGCVSVPFAVSINQPDAISYTINLQPITCDPMAGGTNPGSITVESVTGGTAEYTYHLTGNNGYSATYNSTAGGEDHTFAILEFGIYEVDVVDANGCSLLTTNIIASPPNDLDIDVSAVTASCAAGGTAIVTVSSTVGSGDYQFAILETFTAPYSTSYVGPDVPMGDTATFNGLTPGITYTFVVYDNVTNCYYFEEAATPINSPSAMTATLDVVTNISCTGAADGNVTFTFDGFDALATDVSYEIFNAQSNTTTTITGTTGVNPLPGPITISNLGPLDQGVYYVLLREVGGPFDGCGISTADFTIMQSTNLLQVTAASPINDNCDLNAGVITATAQFGTPPYEFQYLLDTATPPTATSAGWISDSSANVEAGDYIVYVKDANDCIQNDAVTVDEDPRPEFTLAVVDECVNEGLFEVLITLTNPGVASPPFTLSVNGGPGQSITFNGSNQYTITGLSSGAGQTLALSDINGCTDTDTFSIEPPLQFNATLTTLLDCEPAPANNAQITIEVTSGSGNYDYEIAGPVNQARTAITGSSVVWTDASSAGNYTITVYDTGTSVPNCSGSIIVNVPAAVVPNIAVDAFQNVSCNGADDGTITVTSADVGIGPYTYEIVSGPGSSATFPITSTATGTTAEFTGLEGSSGGITYTIRITAANGCFTETTQVITEPDIISNVTVVVDQFTCASGNNTDNASITVQAGITGGSGTYVIYEFIEEDDPNTGAVEAPVIVQSGSSPTYIEPALEGGVYTINVYDDNGCIGTTTATIQPFDTLQSASVAITTAATCTSGEAITITATGLLTNSTTDPANYEFRELPSGTFQTSGNFTGLAVGIHNFEIRNTVTGCLITVPHTVADPEVLHLDVLGTTDTTCFGDTDGTVTLDVQDATNTTYPDAITYTLYQDVNNTPTNLADDVTSVGADADGSFTISGLAAGSYFIEVVDTNPPGSDCTYGQAFTITGPATGLSASVIREEITCVPGSDGVIEITNVQGGYGNYLYYVSATPIPDEFDPLNYVATPRFENLTADTYEIWVIDAGGCPLQLPDETLDVPNPIVASLTVTNPNCTNIEGSIEVSVPTGGQGSNYTFQLIRNGGNVGSPQTTRSFDNLGEGLYTVEVLDQWGCSLITNAVQLYDEIVPEVTIDKLIDCTVDPGGHITLAPTGGSGTFDFSVTFPDTSTPLPDILGANTATFTDLTQPGTYTFTITDTATGHSCVKTITATLDNFVAPVLLNATITPVSCFGGADGSILANLDSTTDDNPPYQYELIGLAGAPSRPLQNDPLFTGLPLGDYQVRVVSSRGCEDVRNETITEPNALMASASATPFACNPDNTVNTSTITVTATDGTAPYRYSIDNVNFLTTNTFEIIDNGAVQNITVYVIDANGCTTTAIVAPIDPVNAFTVAVTQNIAITCVNPEQVLLTITDNGHPGNIYDFELLPVGNPTGSFISNPSPTSALFELADVGSYTFRITDTVTGCYVDTAPYTIAPYDLIQVDAIATAPAVCFTDAGSIEINVSGYSGPYSYIVYSTGGTPVLTGSGNTSTNPFTIPDPTALLVGGNYYVEVTEDPSTGCVDTSNTVTIISPDMPLDVSVNEVANVTCTNDQGEIRVTPTGGYTPYDIVLTNTTTGQVYTENDVIDFVFAGLSEGDYDVDITDDGGCTISRHDVLTLALPTPVVTDINVSTTLLTCYGDTNASVSADLPTGGSGTYQYQLNIFENLGDATPISNSGFQSSAIFDNLGAGVYSITVSDGWNCDVTTNQVQIDQPEEVMANLIQTAPMTCTTDASLLLTAAGGDTAGTYQYYDIATATWINFNGGNTHTFTGVTADSYQYTIRDANSCEATISNEITVDAVPTLELDIDDSAAFINCTGEASATIIANASGGLGNYFYELYNADPATSAPIAGPVASNTFNGLVAGNYYIRVISQDCETTTPDPIPIMDPLPLQVEREEFTNVTCSGLEDGTITVEVSGGTGDIFYAITPNLNQFDTVNTFTGLAPGVYDVIAQDRNGCFITFQFPIVEPDPITANAINIQHEVCVGDADGSFDLEIMGGTTPYRTSINSNDDADFVQDQLTFGNLPAGTHVVFVRDAQDCETNVIVAINPGVNLNATITPIYTCNGIIPENALEVTLEDASVSADVLYALDSTDLNDLQLTPDFTNIAPGAHYLTIVHANGCLTTIDFEIESFEPLTLVLEQNNINEITAVVNGGSPDYTIIFDGNDNGDDNTYIINRTDTYLVTVIDLLGCEVSAEIDMEFIDIEVPNFFTPDGDGMNDYWIPENLEAFPNVLMIIFDRYGRELYRMGYGDTGWNGIYNNADLPTGDYWYIIKLQGESDDREFVGHFTLYR
ncbi:MAG: T9SS type B sorting domain-containing protein [Bacteroidota bacterium]